MKVFQLILQVVGQGVAKQRYFRVLLRCLENVDRVCMKQEDKGFSAEAERVHEVLGFFDTISNKKCRRSERNKESATLKRMSITTLLLTNTPKRAKIAYSRGKSPSHHSKTEDIWYSIFINAMSRHVIINIPSLLDGVHTIVQYHMSHTSLIRWCWLKGTSAKRHSDLDSDYKTYLDEVQRMLLSQQEFGA